MLIVVFRVELPPPKPRGVHQLWKRRDGVQCFSCVTADFDIAFGHQKRAQFKSGWSENKTGHQKRDGVGQNKIQGALIECLHGRRMHEAVVFRVHHPVHPRPFVSPPVGPVVSEVKHQLKKKAAREE